MEPDLFMVRQEIFLVQVLWPMSQQTTVFLEIVILYIGEHLEL